MNACRTNSLLPNLELELSSELREIGERLRRHFEVETARLVENDAYHVVCAGGMCDQMVVQTRKLKL
jgi:hypothetical protein